MGKPERATERERKSQWDERSGSCRSKVTRVGASEWSRGDASDIDGQTTGRDGREHMSQCGQRASFNRERDLADEPHWCSSVFGCRDACGVADSIDNGYHDVVTAENWGHAPRVLV